MAGSELDPKLMAAEAPSTPGSRYLNHAGCPAGEDRKRRLWLVRNANGSVNGFCHNCGLKGYIRHAPRVGPAGITKPTGALLETRELNYAVETWPAEARGWLSKYNVEAWEAEAAFAPDYDRIVLPIHDHTHSMVGQQMRAIYPLQVPKYLTRGFANAGAWEANSEFGDVVVVEDILSAVKVGRQCDSVALLRTTISPHIINTIIEKYQRVHVWLDPDDAGRTATLKVVAMLSPLIETRAIYHEKQPKEATNDDITRALDGSTSTPTHP